MQHKKAIIICLHKIFVNGIKGKRTVNEKNQQSTENFSSTSLLSFKLVLLRRNTELESQNKYFQGYDVLSISLCRLCDPANISIKIFKFKSTFKDFVKELVRQTDATKKGQEISSIHIERCIKDKTNLC